MMNARVADIHSHMLPGIDDGSRNFDMTKQMIKLAYAEGCRHLFLTPHADYLEYGDAKVSEKMDAIREWIATEKMNLKIYPGAEIFAAVRTEEEADAILKKVKTGLYPTLNGTKYVLIEFALGGFEIDRVLPVVQGLIAAGYTPVIAHAERYGMCFDELRYLKSLGCLLQMNICDLYYIYENDINRMAHLLLEEKLFDFVGTDAHGINRRPPKLKEYIDYLYRNYDEEYVDAILFENAVRVLGENINTF